MGAINYDPLPTSCDLCIAAVERAVAQLPPSGPISIDLWISQYMYDDGWAKEIFDRLPQGLLVNRLRVEKLLDKYEWFIERGNGDCVGSNPPS